MYETTKFKGIAEISALVVQDDPDLVAEIVSRALKLQLKNWIQHERFTSVIEYSRRGNVGVRITVEFVQVPFEVDNDERTEGGGSRE